MVHALEEIRRTLVPGGTLIDLRPLADRWPVEVVANGAAREIGRLVDLSAGLADDESANNAIALAKDWGWFSRQAEDVFSIYLYWDNPPELFEQVTVKWENFVAIEDDVRKAVVAAWKKAGPDRALRVKVKMLLTRWKKM